MKSNKDFDTDKAFKDYLRIYSAALNMSSMLCANSQSFDIIDDDTKMAIKNVANLATACADALVNELFQNKKESDTSSIVGVATNKKSEQIKLRTEIDSYVHMGKELFKDKKYAEALKSFETALSLEPTNKHIQKEIEMCNKWIKAVSSLDELQEEKPFKAVPIKKEESEFTTDFPALE